MSLLRPMMNRTSQRPAVAASSTTYWIAGLSTTGSISLGTALVAGRNRVPSPAAGITALRRRAGPGGRLDMAGSLASLPLCPLRPRSATAKAALRAAGFARRAARARPPAERAAAAAAATPPAGRGWPVRLMVACHVPEEDRARVGRLPDDCARAGVRVLLPCRARRRATI